MNRAEIKRDILLNYIKLYKYLLYINVTKKEYEIGNLYLNYIKDYIYLNNTIPNKYTWKSWNICYFYALNIKTPRIFNYYSKKIVDDYFGLTVGSIANDPLDDEKDFNLDNFFNCLYADLDALNIKYYDSTINSENKHNGYKIAIYFNNQNKDYHFARQNEDSLWSSKYGLKKTIFVSDNPLIFQNNPFIPESKYEYIKTLEIKKPSL